MPSGGFEGYSYEVDESCVHFDMCAEAHVSRHELYLLLETLCFAIIIGALLGIPIQEGASMTLGRDKPSWPTARAV